MDLKKLNPKVKTILLVVCMILLVVLSVFAGGILACNSGHGKLMEDFSCVNTERLDLCRSPDGVVWQYNDKNIPKISLNLSNTEAD